MADRRDRYRERLSEPIDVAPAVSYPSKRAENEARTLAAWQAWAETGDRTKLKALRVLSDRQTK